MLISHQQLQDINKVQIEILRAVSNVCEHLNLKFFMVHGSLLGTIRNHKFVPDDDDIDIAVMESDLDKVHKVLANELDSEKYYYHKSRADYHPHVILKSHNTEDDLRQMKSVFLDIFIISGYPE